VLALILSLAVLAFAYLLIVAPLLDFYAEREATIETRRMLLPRLNAAKGELPLLRAQAAELHAAATTHKVTLEGASDAIASAALQSHIEEVTAAAGATIGSAEGLPAEARGTYRRIGLRLVLSGPYETLVALFAKLEAATPPLIIDNVQIRGLQRRAGVSEPLSLDAGFDVYGFRADEGAAKP
jgi:general secretion pathway protein M